MVIQRAAAVRGGIGDSSSLMKIAFSCVKSVSEHHNIRPKEHQRDSQKADRKGGMGGVNAYGQPDRKILGFFTPSLREASSLKSTFCTWSLPDFFVGPLFKLFP